MISKLKLGAIALVAAMIGAASPAFAQGYPTETATGAYGWHSHRGYAARNGEDAYAEVPHSNYGSDLSPSATGGGSVGYNWAAGHDY